MTQLLGGIGISDGGPGAFPNYPGQSITTTGTLNQLVPTSGLVYLDNAADLILNGIAAGRDGDFLTLVSRGAGNVFANHLNGGAVAADQLQNTVTSGFTPAAAGKGMYTYQYDGSVGVQKWRLLSHRQGDFISIPFASCTYDSNTGAFWTVASGDIATQKYLMLDRTMMLVWSINSTTTTLTGVGARLRVNFSSYAPWVWNDTTRSMARVVDGGAAQMGMCTAAAGTTALLQFSHDIADTPWNVGTNRGMNGVTLLLGVT